MRGLIGLLVALTVVAAAAALGVGQGLDNSLRDWHWRLAAERTPNPLANLTLVAIDDKTLAATDPQTGKRFGRLGEWSRERYARLLDRLGQAKAVGLDLLFLESGRDAAGDTALAAAMARHGRTVLAVSSGVGSLGQDEQARAAQALLLSRLPAATSAAGLELPAVNAAALSCPLPELVRSAAAVGLVDVTSDRDGVYRQLTPVVQIGSPDRLLAHLAVATALVAYGESLTDATPTADGLLLAGRRLPLSGGRLLLRPVIRRPTVVGPGWPVRTVSFSDALQADPAEFRDQIVLVGETATGTPDIRPNPLDAGLRGVEFNFDALANLLVLPSVSYLPVWANLLLMLLAIGGPLTLFGLLRPKPAALGSVAYLVTLLGAMELLFWLGGWVPSFAPVLLGGASAVLVTGLLRLAEEEQAKRQIRSSFGMYVAPEVVALIAEDPSIASQEGVRTDMAVLFSDVRGFTSYSEQNPPELVVKQMREYLTEMTASVDDHRGVLDKFVGDAVMALFGPFLEEGVNAAALAVGSGLDMLERLDALNEQWKAQGWPEFKIGIGIHFGPAILGNIGSERKMQYTALGDTVNTAARLESATKEMKATLLISDEVRALAAPALGAAVEFVPLGDITVRNRSKPITVFSIHRSG